MYFVLTSCEVWLLLILDPALEGLSNQCHAPAALYLRERTPGTHCTGGCVGLRAGLDIEARRKVFACAGDQTPADQSVLRHYTD
jgi:hypothetical protein